MAILQLQGSDYFEGTDGVRRQYGPGLFDMNDAGQIIGPHVAPERSADGQETVTNGQSENEELAPSQEARMAAQTQPVDNGG